LLIVDEVGDHDLVEQLRMDGLVLDRQHIFDAPIEVARHAIGGADVDPGFGVGQLMTFGEAP
jgi:hypothetical protein